MAETHSAAGPAAGYHFQIQRALLDLMTAENDETAISIETLDDLMLSDADRGDVLELEQLKHSINPGSLTDVSRPWWEALGVWMDLSVAGELSGEERLTLVCTHDAPAGSAAALLRSDEHRQVDAALALLLNAARTSENAATAAARRRFAGVSDDAIDDASRRRLVDRIFVVDGAAPVDDFRLALRTRLRVALPAAGIDAFLDQVVGRWERWAVDLLVRRRTTVTKGALLAEIAQIRDGFTDHSLPAPDAAEDLDEVILGSYQPSAFVHQLRFLDMRSTRIRLAITDYHRACAQRAAWLNDGVLGPGQLTEWEDRLVDEWLHAFERMLDRVEDETDAPTVSRAGLQLYDLIQDSDRTPLLGSADFFLNRGAQHGLADVRRIGWHRDFQQRLEEILGAAEDRQVEDAYREAVSEAPGRQ